jgi:Uma2 family endonuclease
MGMRMEVWPRRHRITVDEYHRMAEVGLLAPEARVELIDGEIIDMAPIGPPHESIVDYLNRLLVRAVGDQAIVRVQGSVRLSRSTEPQPDLLLLRPRLDFYRHRHAAGEDTLLAIEVSESSLRYDREIKVPLYARHGIPEVWVVDLPHGELHIHRALVDGRYAQQQTLVQPGFVELTMLPGVVMDLAGLALTPHT